MSYWWNDFLLRFLILLLVLFELYPSLAETLRKNKKYGNIWEDEAKYVYQLYLLEIFI
jgi:hypothetical protein